MVNIKSHIASLLLCCLPASTLAQRLGEGNFIGLPISNADAIDVIADNYIVVWNNSFPLEEIESRQALFTADIRKRNLNKRSEISGALLSQDVQSWRIREFMAMGFQSDSKMLMSIADQPEVAYIEAVTRVKTTAVAAQENAPLGLIRMSNEELRNGRNLGGYVFDTSGGEGITAYVVDTGIMTEHVEFQGRATLGANFVPNSRDTDENGHGSHVSGTIGGRTYGVAKQVSLVGVKVLDGEGQGSNDQVLAGMQWSTCHNPPLLEAPTDCLEPRC